MVFFFLYFFCIFVATDTNIKQHIYIFNIMAHTHCLIIGSGPAGYTAAIYAARANMKPVLYTGSEPGGQLMITNDVENYPGYPDGVVGPMMMADFQRQAERFGTEIHLGVLIDKVDFSTRPLTAWTDAGDKITADSIIIATGASAKWLGLPAERRLANKGVSACAVCDGFFFRGKEVAVVGGGDTAAEEATYLAKMCPKVHLFVRKDALRASKIMQDRVKNTPNIVVHWNTEIQDVLGEDEVVAVQVINNQTKAVTEIATSALFIAIGHQPNTKIFNGVLDMDETGYLITTAGRTTTNIEGVFACGDAQDKIYRQAVTAAGTGCMAALDAERYLAAQGHI
jgi:thioredoxin reductase (NADPH)